jgi:nucleoid-associated protein YgaU
MLKKIFTLMLFAVIICSAQDMTYEQYVQALGDTRQREEVARTKIAQLQTQIASIKEEIESVKKEAKQFWEDILALVGITQEQYDAFINQLEDLRSQIAGFEALYSEDLPAWARALAQAEKDHKEHKKNKIAIIPRVGEFFTGIEQALKDSREAMELAKSSRGGDGTYTVQLVPYLRDCLWRIAGKPEVYGDAQRWQDIYKANTNIINNPNLIFPGQVLNIPR